MTLSIRDASVEDAEAIAQLINELAATIGEKSPITSSYVEHILDFPCIGILLAEKEKQVIGLLSYSLHPNLYHAADSCAIDELIVTKDARGQDIGSSLIKALFERLMKADVAEVSVSTMPDNRDAIRFYHAHGLTDHALYLERHFEKD